MAKKRAAEYLRELYGYLDRVVVTDGFEGPLDLESGVNEAIALIARAKSAPNKIMVIGNGGSAAIAAHMQNDLCKAVGAKAMVFDNAPLMTALSNDDGYECVYRTPLVLWSDAGDVLVAISSSGRSTNILAAVDAAKSIGCAVITFSGFDIDNSLRTLGDLNFYVPSGQYGYVETAHAVLTHLITDMAACGQAREGETDDA